MYYLYHMNSVNIGCNQTGDGVRRGHVTFPSFCRLPVSPLIPPPMEGNPGVGRL